MLSRHTTTKITYILITIILIIATIGVLVLLESKSIIFQRAINSSSSTGTPEPFPVGVNAHTAIIKENPAVENFFYETLALNQAPKDGWWNKIAVTFANRDWYQNLASPVSRIVVIWPGQRKEEITAHIGDILRWDVNQRLEFQQLIDSSSPILPEGKYYPGQYVTHRYATPSDMQQLISNSFFNEIQQRYTSVVESQVPFEQALIIASLLEREASDFQNMREVAGVIWKRLFINMPLQLDATLQYVKGSRTQESKWWPMVKPDDKYLESAYNTYRHNGLPPAPISNPSVEAVLAALNPVQTDCLYYFHTKDGSYHCSTTYDEHVKKLKIIYGQGS